MIETLRNIINEMDKIKAERKPTIDIDFKTSFDSKLVLHMNSHSDTTDGLYIIGFTNKNGTFFLKNVQQNLGDKITLMGSDKWKDYVDGKEDNIKRSSTEGMYGKLPTKGSSQSQVV